MPGCGCVKIVNVFIIAQEFAGDEFPVQHIVAVPVSFLIGGEEEKFFLKIYNYGIGSSTVFSLFRKNFERRVAIVDVNGIAICFLLAKTEIHQK